MKVALHELYQAIGYHPKLEKFKEGNANTAFVTHANKTYALAEMNYPFEIAIPKSDEDFGIQSKGYNNFNDQLKHNVSAHPKVDKKK